jgi:enoyl-CoA hydratase/carnithine racemase
LIAMSEASATGQTEDTARQKLRVEKVRPHVALVTLDRPEVMNAIDSALAVAIEAAVGALDADAEVRVVVLTGAGGRAFCAGADMKEIAADPASSRRTAAGGFAGFVDLPHAKPWIAAVEGVALGGGFEIALACDLIVASATARFGLPEVKRANLAVGGGLRRLPRAVPRAIAIEMILTGEPIDATRALALGLLNRLTPAGRALDAALALADVIAGNAPLAVTESLAIARIAAERPQAELKAVEEAAYEANRRTQDHLEGARAFVERRPPRWRAK